jgi:hypothetical protein
MNVKAMLFLIAILSPLFMFANHPSGLSNGTIVLKGGETLNGFVAPLGEFPNNGTLFQAEKSGKKTIISYDRIEKVQYDGIWYTPATVVVNNKNVQAYLEQKASGAANLYKAFYYAPKQMGKNNSMIQKQWSWVVSTPHHGKVALGHNPTSSQLAKALDHPAVDFVVKAQKLSEESILQIIEDYNSTVASNNAECPRM